MVDAPELQLAALDEEVMGVIVKDIMTVTMNTLTKEFKNRKVGEGKVTWELLEGSREKLLYPLHRAMAETVDLSEQNLSTQFLADRSVIIQKEFRLLESVKSLDLPKLFGLFVKDLRSTAFRYLLQHGVPCWIAKPTPRRRGGEDSSASNTLTGSRPGDSEVPRFDRKVMV